jgi:hypothetical protein
MTTSRSEFNAGGGPPPRRSRRQRTRWDTQDAAWDAIQPRLGTIHAKVLDAIKAMPSTCDELEQCLDLTHQTCSASVNHLMNAGLIAACDVRPTRSGRKARVWAVREPDTLFPIGGAA